MKFRPLTPWARLSACKKAGSISILCLQLHIVCDGKRHHEASYSKTWCRRENIDIMYALFHLVQSYKRGECLNGAPPHYRGGRGGRHSLRRVVF